MNWIQDKIGNRYPQDTQRTQDHETLSVGHHTVAIADIDFWTDHHCRFCCTALVYYDVVGLITWLALRDKKNRAAVVYYQKEPNEKLR